MKVYEYVGTTQPQARSHPWTDSVESSAFRYHDLRATPALIRRSLEDFSPWEGYDAVEDFYQLLEWLNGANSPLESNDCAFTAPQPNTNSQFEKALECSGRIMVLFRDLPRNLGSPHLLRFTESLQIALSIADPGFDVGVVGTTLVPVRYLKLAGGPVGQRGVQLMISFWAWGDTEAETMASLGRVMRNLASGLRSVATAEA
jgi:hypothetical protein